MKTNNLVSIIVPVYKVEKYLNKCVESIVNQTYTNLEIILVDDGSPDDCGKICDEYKKADRRIKVIHKQNGGLSSARNAGLDICSGDYICFVDSDDEIAPDYVEILLKKQQEYNADIVCCLAKEINEQSNENFIWKSVQKDTVFSDNIIESYYKLRCGNDFDNTFTVAWNKIYKKEIFNDLRYTEGRIYEDSAILLLILNKCKRLVIVPNALYYYLRSFNSITKSQMNQQKIDSKTKNLVERIEFLKNNNYVNLCKNEFSSIGSFVREFFKAKGRNQKKLISSQIKLLWKNYHKLLKINSFKNLAIYCSVLFIKMFY